MSTDAEVLRGNVCGLCLTVGSPILESPQFSTPSTHKGTSRQMQIPGFNFRFQGITEMAGPAAGLAPVKNDREQTLDA
jgi:hypothetical protein